MWGTSQLQTISEDDPAVGEIPDAAAEKADSLMPLLYAEVLSHKADASAGVQRLLARARDDHGFRCDLVGFVGDVRGGIRRICSVQQK